MRRLLLQSYPLHSIRERFLYALAVSLFVYAFLALLQPFDMNRLESAHKPWILAGYGTAVFLLLGVLYAALPELMRAQFNETKWKVYKEIIWQLAILVVIGISLSVYEELIGTRRITVFAALETVGKTFVIGIFPIVALVFLNTVRLLRKHLFEAHAMASRINRHEAHSEGLESLVEILSDNKSESFSRRPSDILYIVALGNYVEICCRGTDGLERIILRLTLARAADQLAAHENFYRCHRTYIVNLDTIASVDGNASGYLLGFEGAEEKVPVSRRNTASFRLRMETK